MAGGRVPNFERLETAWRAVMDRPGLSAWELSQSMGLRMGLVTSILVTMENNGYLLSEDGDGGLYPFELRGRAREPRPYVERG